MPTPEGLNSQFLILIKCELPRGSLATLQSEAGLQQCLGRGEYRCPLVQCRRTSTHIPLNPCSNGPMAVFFPGWAGHILRVQDSFSTSTASPALLLTRGFCDLQGYPWEE